MAYSQEKLEKLRKRWETKRGKTLVEKIKKTRCFTNIEEFRSKIKGLPMVDDEDVKDAIDLRGINLM